MPSYILAIDQGTTGTTALLVDRSLRVAAKVNRQFPQYFPRLGWVEHDLREIWDSVLAATRAALRQARARPEQIAAIGITNQRETVAVWDRKSLRPAHRAIVWQDRRTADDCRKLREQLLEPLYRARTGLLLDPYFSGTKLAWLLREKPELRRRAEAGDLCFGTIDSFLVARLSKGAVHVTDVSNASRTLLFDIHKLAWDPELLAPLEIPERMLPTVVGNSEIVARTRDVPGLPDGIPIAGMAGDQQAALFGQTCFEAGESKCTYGTGAFLLLNTGSTAAISERRLLTTVAWRLGKDVCYALEGSVFVAGAAVQWLRDGLRLIKRAPDIEALARTVKDSGGVTFVPALTGLGAPHWRPEARGLISGIERGTTSGHVARAVLEGIALAVADLAQAMAEDSGKPLSTLKVDGGASANDLLMQLQADLLEVPVERPRFIESTGLGAAFLAGLAVGTWSSLEELRRIPGAPKRFRSRMNPEARAALQSRWRAAVERA
jgi:glycerol kinase